MNRLTNAMISAASARVRDTRIDVRVGGSRFNPGLFVAQPASLQILKFSSNGSLAVSPSLAGDVNGTLPATVTFDNGTGFNDYFQGFTFGSTLSFDLSLYGPALSSPDGVATSGSRFACSMFSDAAGTIPALTTDTTDGFAFIVTVNLDGSTTVTNFSAQTLVSLVFSVTASPNVLWPPNKKMVSVSLAVSLSGSLAVCQISAVSSNEPMAGETEWVVTGPLTLTLMADRAGSGKGRVYTITVTCTNSANVSGSQTVTVSVPHDQGK
jgi:hypothetical protein